MNGGANGPVLNATISKSFDPPCVVVVPFTAVVVVRLVQIFVENLCVLGQSFIVSEEYSVPDPTRDIVNSTNGQIAL